MTTASLSLIPALLVSAALVGGCSAPADGTAAGGGAAAVGRGWGDFDGEPVWTCPLAAASGAHVWSEAFGHDDGSQMQLVRAVAVDAAGDVVLVGSYKAAIDFGGGPLPSSGERNRTFVAKLGPHGEHRWSHGFGPGDAWASSVAVDADGQVVVAGGLMGSVDFGGGLLSTAGNFNAFVAKLTPDGAHVFSTVFGVNAYTKATGVAVGAHGEIALTGVSNGAVDFGGGSTHEPLRDNAFLVSFAPDGTYRWSHQFGTDMSTYAVDFDEAPAAVAFDGSGNVVVTGSYSGTTDFGGGPLTSVGTSDVFVAKFAPTGAHVWSRRFGDENQQIASALAIDARGHVVVAGLFLGTIELDDGPLTSGGASDVFIAQLSADGTRARGERFGGADDQYATGVAVDACGEITLTGYGWGSIDFGGGAVSLSSLDDSFVAHLGHDGRHVWSRALGASIHISGPFVASAAEGGSVIAGPSFDGVDMGGGRKPGAIFVGRLAR